MPLPKVKQGEKASEYLTRCIPVETKAGKSTNQAAAICYKEYREQTKAK
jgi:hypothetical protein